MNEQAGRRAIHVRVDAEMEAHLERPQWSGRQKLALAARILAAEGHASGLAGQLTARAEQPDTWWTLRWGVGFDEATASSLVRVDQELNVVEGGGMPNPAVRFHVWVYRARPDAQCIVHTHPPFVSALSIAGEPLAVAHMDACMLYDDCAWLPTWPGVPIADDEGEIISAALGSKRTILLAHHGQLAAGRDVEEATYLSVFLERAARMQVRARAIGPIQPIPPDKGREAHDFLLKPEIVGATFAHLARQQIRADASVLE